MSERDVGRALASLYELIGQWQCDAHRLPGGKCYMAPEIRDQVPWESPIK